MLRRQSRSTEVASEGVSSSSFNNSNNKAATTRRQRSKQQQPQQQSKLMAFLTALLRITLLVSLLAIASRFAFFGTQYNAGSMVSRIESVDLRFANLTSVTSADDGTKQSNIQQKQQRKQQQPLRKSKPNPQDDGAAKDFAYYKTIAMDLAALEPDELLETLQRDDPFGVNQFSQELVARETALERSLTLEELTELFPCPHHRMALPDIRNRTRSDAYKRQLQRKQDEANTNDEFTFLFFQHLRKAGGTHFCSLAKTNLPKTHVPSYYCMPDYGWEVTDAVKEELAQAKRREPRQCAGCLSQWTNDQIVSRMREKEHWIAGNEWDWLTPDHLRMPGAVFATSFREPLDRALSQFRFECVEDRGCKIKNVTKWWEIRKGLWNVYSATFANGDRVARLTHGPSFAGQRRTLVGTALDALQQFNLITHMEWLAYAGPLVQSILGFADVSGLTKRVRPHIGQAQRTDGQEENAAGAASIAKASWQPRDYLDAPTYKMMSESLAMDDILTQAARRMFLERLVCKMDG